MQEFSRRILRKSQIYYAVLIKYMEYDLLSPATYTVPYGLKKFPMNIKVLIKIYLFIFLILYFGPLKSALSLF